MVQVLLSALLALAALHGAASALSCQETCEAAGHCTAGLVTCNQQPTCSFGCAIGGIPGVAIDECEAECSKVVICVI
jgi:hypothetical protein